jgi:hypothetical protein
MILADAAACAIALVVVPRQPLVANRWSAASISCAPLVAAHPALRKAARVPVETVRSWSRALMGSPESEEHTITE